MKKRKLVYLFFCLFFSLNFSSYAKEFSPEMKSLCKAAETTPFVPLPTSTASPNPHPLYHAIEMGADASTIASILSGNDPDKIVVPPGITPLIAASAVGNWPAAKFLIDIGSNINIRRADISITPLEAALITSKYSIACKLIQNHAKFPTSKTDRNRIFSTAQLSTFSPQEDAAIFVEYMIENGFDVNSMGNPLATPLMGAVSLSNIPVIKVLLKHGARLDISKKNGLTVWDMAKKKNNPEVIELLTAAKEKQNSTKARNGKNRK
ncbi:ankyrin repeat domain-containing protein [Acidovorax sp. Leaf78]|uniref:ankyrin repeat domain-containing protein n=1 Tax=unclassified Acidovorax TaxID=2684926 RepID=UPI000B14ACB7|nr:ankyrin repeat domain-containing protein [Acidovorax sp. Leaf78]